MTRQFQLLSTSAYLVAAVLLIGLCLQASEGHFIYTLDDPYIHLAVAENILRGGYGINLSEFSSPSSSILWPYLMAGTLWLGVGDWGPLLVNVPATTASVWIFSGLLWKLIGADAQVRGKRFWMPAVALFAILSINAIALPMTGMEHSLHVLGAILVVSGLAELVEREKTASWQLVFGIVLCSLIRFEGLALSLAALVALVWMRKYRTALFGALMLGVTFGAWTAFMLKHGLPLLPSSVMVKSQLAAAAADGSLLSALKSTALHLYASLTNSQGVFLALSIAFLSITFGFVGKSCDKRRAVLLVVVPASFALIAHLLFGAYGWFGRYEVYAIAIAISSLACSLPVAIPMASHSAFRLAGICTVLAVAAVPYLAVTAKSPAASRNIYEQQFQMHRFATEFFPRNVGVNDLGWVAYKNDAYVLDLYGLGSEQVRRLRGSGQMTSERVAQVVEEYGVDYVMLYDSWFKGVIPLQWCRIAVLQTSKVTAADDKVAFYLVRSGKRREMTAQLTTFATGLPLGSSLEILGCAEP